MEQLAVQFVVVGDEVAGAAVAEVGTFVAEGVAETHIEGLDAAVEAGVGREQTGHGARKIEAVGHALAPRAALQRGDDLVGQAFLHAHHLLHEGAVGAKPGQKGEEPIPAIQVVVDATVDEADHAAEDGVIGLYGGLGHAHNAAELLVDFRVGAAGEGVGQRRGHAAVAFDDVAVVPQNAHGVGIGDVRQGGDWTGLEQVEIALRRGVDGPFDILRSAEVGFGAPRHLRHCQHLRIGQHGRGRVGHRALDDVAGAGDSPRVRVLLTGHERIPIAAHGGDDGDAAAAADRVRGEGDAGRVRMHHALHEHGGRCRGRVHALLGAVGIDAVTESGTPHVHDACGRGTCVHIEIAFELSGEGMRGGVLIRGGRAHGHRLALRCEPVERGAQVGKDLRREGQIRERGLGGLCVAGVVEGSALVAGEAGVEGGWADHEPGWDGQSAAGEVGQGGGLATEIAAAATAVVTAVTAAGPVENVGGARCRAACEAPSPILDPFTRPTRTIVPERCRSPCRARASTGRSSFPRNLARRGTGSRA